MFSTCPHNMVNFGLLTAGEFGAPLQISTGFASWQRYCTASSSGRQPKFAALNRGRHLCSAGRPSCWALAHILVIIISVSCRTETSPAPCRLTAGTRCTGGGGVVCWSRRRRVGAPFNAETPPISRHRRHQVTFYVLARSLSRRGSLPRPTCPHCPAVTQNYFIRFRLCPSTFLSYTRPIVLLDYCQTIILISRRLMFSVR